MSGINCSIAGATYAAGRTAKTIVVEGTAAVSTAQSQFGGASLLTGVNRNNGVYVDRGNCTDIRDWYTYTGFTAEFWVRPTNMTNPDDGFIPASLGIMEKEDSPAEWGFGHIRTGQVRFVYNAAGGTTVSTSGITLAINNWYHLAFVKNGTNLKIYVNGTERASATYVTVTTPASRPLSIGSYYRVGAASYIDEVRISKIARYTAGFTSPTAAFTNDANTLFLMHANGTNGSTTFTDDNA